ncbi:T9SS type A sorting domain-containing protein, partial [Candidatus Kryptobacter tengchongensis]|uniref:T9SS type A sorting domain-containing protein n=1 Tax=Kryptobacter tengchongensis TaxID=1643429 RepID=UPI00070769C1
RKIYISEYNWANISKNHLLELKKGDTVKIKFDIDNIYEDLKLYTLYLQYRKTALPQGYAGVKIVIDSTYTFEFDMCGSNYGDYIWVDKISGTFELSKGEHSIFLYFHGNADNEFAWIDYFIIQPVIERKIFVSPDGKEFKLERTIITKVGEKSSNEDDDIKLEIFPNPFNFETTIFYSAKQPFGLKIYDSTGREIYNLTSKALNNSGFIRVNLSNFSSGMYFCLLKGIDYAKIKKFVLVK